MQESSSNFGIAGYMRAMPNLSAVANRSPIIFNDLNRATEASAPTKLSDSVWHE